VQIAQAQPEAISGYVPPERADPTGAPVIAPSRRERELQTLLNANQGNPYAAQSPAAVELQNLQAARAQRQAEQNKLFEANVIRTTKREEQIQAAKMDQLQRKYQAEETRQKLVDYGRGRVGQDSQDQPALLGTPQSPQRTGVPEADPAPRGVIPQDWAKAQEKKITQDSATLDTAKPEVAEAINLLNEARKHPAKEWSLGSLGGLAKLTPAGQGFAAILEQIKGKNFLAGYQKLKGSGNVSEIEGLKTEQAQARLTTAQTKEDFDSALADLERSLRGSLERAERKMRRPVTAYQNTPDDPHAPDIGQRGIRGGKPVEYIGGDPSQDSSYRTLR
jgi:hypothetical protein